MRYGGWAQSLALIFLLFHLLSKTLEYPSDLLGKNTFCIFLSVFAANECARQVWALDAAF